MTDDDRFFQRLRGDAARLRYDVPDVMLTRLAARVRERVAAQPTVAGFLARWFRPLAASLSVLALAAMLGVQWYERNQQQTTTTLEAAMSAEPVEISMDGNTISLSQ